MPPSTGVIRSLLQVHGKAWEVDSEPEWKQGLVWQGQGQDQVLQTRGEEQDQGPQPELEHAPELNLVRDT